MDNGGCVRARADHAQPGVPRPGKRLRHHRYHHQPAAVVIREDRELLAELTRLNSDMATLALRIMEGSANTSEQQHYAQPLIAAEKRSLRRAEHADQIVLDGEVLADELIILPAQTVEPGRRE